MVFLPLIVSLSALLLISIMLRQAELSEMEENRSKSIITLATRLQRNLLQTSSSMLTLRFTRQSFFALRYKRFNEDTLADLSALNKACKKSRYPKALLLKLNQDVEKVLSASQDLSRQEKSAGLKSFTTDQSRILQVFLDASTAFADLKAIEERELKRKSKQNVLVSRNLDFGVKLSVFASVILNIVLASLLSYFFAKSFSSRFSLILDNTRRLSSSQKLNPPLSGTDELAQLDGSFHEMSEALNKASDALRLSEAKIRDMIESMPVGLLELDREGRIRSVNRSVQKLAMLDEIELVGKNIDAFLRPVKPAAETVMEMLLASKNTKTVELYCKRGADGAEFPAEVSLNDFGQSEQGLILNMQDLSARYEIEQMKREFVSMITHDLRSPLTGIKMFLDLLLDGYLGEISENVRKKAKDSMQSIARLIELVNNLLDVEKLEAGQMQLELDDVPVPSVFSQVVAELLPLAEGRGIALSWNAGDYSVLADRDRLIQVLVNLVSNALKFTPDKGTVKLSASRLTDKPEMIEMRVKDSGRGISEEQSRRLFSRYSQLKAEDGRRGKGTGLGLVICKALSEQMGGSIGVECKPHEGATFWIRLPAAPDD